MHAEMLEKIQTQQAADRALGWQIMAHYGQSCDANAKCLRCAHRKARFVFHTPSRNKVNTISRSGRIVADGQKRSNWSQSIGGAGIQRHANQLAAARSFQEDINRNDRLAGIKRENTRRPRHTPAGEHRFQIRDTSTASCSWLLLPYVPEDPAALSVQGAVRSEESWYEHQTDLLQSATTHQERHDATVEFVDFSLVSSFGDFVLASKSTLIGGATSRSSRVTRTAWRCGWRASNQGNLQDLPWYGEAVGTLSRKALPPVDGPWHRQQIVHGDVVA